MAPKLLLAATIKPERLWRLKCSPPRTDFCSGFTKACTNAFTGGSLEKQGCNNIYVFEGLKIGGFGLACPDTLKLCQTLQFFAMVLYLIIIYCRYRIISWHSTVNGTEQLSLDAIFFLFIRLEGQQPSQSTKNLSLAVLPFVSGPQCAEYCAVLSTPSELTNCKLTIQPTITVCQSLTGHEAII